MAIFYYLESTTFQFSSTKQAGFFIFMAGGSCELLSAREGQSAQQTKTGNANHITRHRSAQGADGKELSNWEGPRQVRATWALVPRSRSVGKQHASRHRPRPGHSPKLPIFEKPNIRYFICKSNYSNVQYSIWNQIFEYSQTPSLKSCAYQKSC